MYQYDSKSKTQPKGVKQEMSKKSCPQARSKAPEEVSVSYQGIIQRLANNAAGNVPEQRENLEKRRVTEAVTADNTRNILDRMGYQRDWIKWYHQNVTLQNAKKALVSATNVAQDLYEIRECLEEYANADSNASPIVDIETTSADKMGRITEIRQSVGLPALDNNKEGTARVTTGFKTEVSRAQQPTPGKRLIHSVKIDPQGVRASMLQENTKRIAELYKAAGDISNESRMLAGDAQIKAGDIQRAGGNAGQGGAHAQNPDTTEKMKTEVEISRLDSEGKAGHGPALAEVDIFDDAGVIMSTVSRINDPLGRIPKKLHPLIAADLVGMEDDKYQSYLSMTKGAGSHAEVYAANKALIYSAISSKDEAEQRLFGRIARTFNKKDDMEEILPDGRRVISDDRTLFTPRGVELPTFAQCPHCEAALRTVTPNIYKSHHIYLEKCAYYIQQEIKDYAPRDDPSIWQCAHAMLDLENWGTDILAEYIYGLTQYGGTQEKDEKNWIAAVHLLSNTELLKYHRAYHH